MKVFKFFFALLLFVATGSAVFSQSTYSVQSANLKVSGTSTLHNWEMKSSKATGQLRGEVNANELKSISSLSVSMPIETLKSGKNGMDKKAYDAMKSSKFKNATFELTSAQKSGKTWKLSGNFTFAGKKKAVTLNVSESTSGNVVSLSGSHSFKLSDYGITPPTAMLGSIKTGNDVKINFTVKFK